MATRNPTSNRLLKWLVVVSIAIATLATAQPVLAQNPGSIELVAQTAWVDDGGIFNVQVRVAGASPDSSVLMRVHEPWTDRDDFLRQDLESVSTTLLELEPVVLGDVQQISNTVIGLEVLVDGPITREEPNDLQDPPSPPQQQDPIPRLTTDGEGAVYPVDIALVDSDGVVIDNLLTSLIELPRRDRRPPLDVSIILESQTTATADATSSPELTPEELAEITILGDIVTQHPDAKVALSLSPQALLALASAETEEAAAIISDLATSLTPEQIMSNPLTSLEEHAWVEAGLATELGELYDAGDAVVNDVLGITPERAIMLLDRTVDGESLDELVDYGVQGLVVRPAQISPLDREVFPQALTTRFLINIEEDGLDETDPDALPALASDGGLANHFTAEGGAVLNANRLLADLVLLSLQNSGGRQSVVINPPGAWEADANFLNVFLSGIERIPLLEGASPIDALASTEITPSLGVGTISGPLRRNLTPPITATSLRSFRTDYSQARNAIDSWATVIGNDNESRARLDELLYLSTDSRLSADNRDNFIDSVYAVINEQKDSAITTPETETITLTGRESIVPIVVENNLASDATVMMLLSSEELDFPESSEIVQTLEPGPNRVEIPITARASGDSPIRIQVLSPDGLVLLGSSEVLVRTFAFSGLGIGIGSVAILVLVVWWVRHVRGARDNVEPLSEVIGV